MSSPVRSWRMAFLTLRDETLASPPRPTVLHLLNHLIFSQSQSLIAAVPDLPPHEVTSDVMFLLELARNISHTEGLEDVITSFIELSHFIHSVSICASLQMNSTSWALVLDSFKRIVEIFLGKAQTNKIFVGNVTVIKATKLCLESIRCLFNLYQATALLSENEQLLNFLLQVVTCFHGESIYSSCLSDNHKVFEYNNVLEVQTIAFTMIGEVYSRVSSSLSVRIWQSSIEVLSKVMDILASKTLLVEDNIMATFYIELLHCLHMLLADPRGSLSGHVAGFVAALRIFFHYGLTNKSHLGSTSKNLNFVESSKSRSGPYRPPHLRKKFVENVQLKDEESLFSSELELSLSSDSDCSDNDGSATDARSNHFAKARLGAIVCIQDLCRADPKLVTAQWTMLLPSSDVLLPRKYGTTLMSCLLFDPSLKVRIAAATTIMAMLDGPSSVFLQVAEFRESSKCGSFTALSSSLGHILMQLHSGTLYLIKHETHSRLLAPSFRILMLLISSTPYSRMSAELLSTVISSVQARIDEGFPLQSDRNSLLAAAINCLTVALSVSPSSVNVNNFLLVEVSTGFLDGQRKSGVLYTLVRYSEQQTSPSVSLEALQALKAMAHNYPNTMVLCWEQVSSTIYRVLKFSPEDPARSWRSNFENTIGAVRERVMAAGIKVLDECLRAISGFKGTEDLSNDKLLDSPFTSDYVKTKAVSSAPFYGLESPASTKDESKMCELASERWSEAIVKHMPMIIQHSTAMVRAAAITCFAGMTSSVFFSLPQDKQDFAIRSSIDAALSDDVPSVRSAACRAIGVIACFPQIFHRTEILEKFIQAAEHNAHDSLVSVRIAASWALANICDSIRHCIDAQPFETGSMASREGARFISLLADSALRLASDNDKVKANAVRALGNLARFVQFTNQLAAHGEPIDCVHSTVIDNGQILSKDDLNGRSDSFQSVSSGNFYWLGKMVQAFLSCMTTGNVKVQWNVCHALSNLFFNKTLKLQYMDWAPSVFSILLLLLRDSSNFKIRIQAAAALAVPESINDYGRSYYDVLHGVEHILENFSRDQISAPSNFKYLIALEKQLTSTMLHVLGLASRTDHLAVQDLLVKKASFLIEWLKGLCSSLEETSSSTEEAKFVASVNLKKDAIFRTVRSLIEVYESSNHHSVARRFDRLANGLL
ncbi:ARM repeat superfamily protein [Forsythia ovata]|uniref:ARM repeat superfamily protein n=1 Tax=Forsythia ovata TaxID=205694 RepID=A0ABD1VNU4_9LAMI